MKPTIKIFILCLFLSTVFEAKAQFSSNRYADVQTYGLAGETAIGLRHGYYIHLAPSINHKITDNLAIDFTAGYRFPNLYHLNDENRRLGAITTIQYHIPLFFNLESTFSIYPALGAHIGRTDYTRSRESHFLAGEVHTTFGVLGGLGMDYRTARFNFNFEFLPGYDFLTPEYSGGKNFFMRRGVGASVRYIINAPF
ncbi:hypothetical protein [Pararhodonellum marinum]|uniref:hypothetical protein n=1 Tax=Pararhodonellum marinum TaxID=2755358 RepID=UPI00188EB6B0|nr:hypothetical protein [Pararhodonellum marinum]